MATITNSRKNGLVQMRDYGYGEGGWDIECGEKMKYLKAVWKFCSYLFVPQRRPKDYYNL